MKKGRVGCGCIALPVGGLVATLVVIGGIAASLNPLGSSASAGTFRGDAVPAEYRDLILKAGQTCSAISPSLLAAQLYQESGFRPDAVSPVGAQGIAQFMPGTWPEWGRDANGDGVANVFDPADAIPAAARYDCALSEYVSRVPGDPQDNMLAAYNAGSNRVIQYNGPPPYKETQDYIKNIRELMRTKFETITPAAGSSVGEAVVTAALSQKGLPYSWGGGTPTGPSEGFGRGAGIVGFDCSSLVQYAVYQATGGKLRLPRVSQEQSRTGQGIASGRGRDINMALLAPGDAIGIDAESNGDVEHIAVYMGNNKIVHAPKPGDVVKESDLSDNYYANATWHVRRYV